MSETGGTGSSPLDLKNWAALGKIGDSPIPSVEIAKG